MASDPSSWSFTPGDRTGRPEVHAAHGGSSGRGISAPALAAGAGNITLWWDPGGGHRFGYRDGFTPDGQRFIYSGMGASGDQAFGGHTSENRRVRDHRENGDRVRLLRKHGKNDHEYVGELKVDRWRLVDSEGEDGLLRQMIEFEFTVVDARPPLQDEYAAGSTTLVSGPSPLPPVMPEPHQRDLEALGKRTFKRSLRSWKRVAERREAILVHEFAVWAHDRGLSVTGYDIPYAPAGRSLVGDAYVAEHSLLIEAKARTSREALRLALGQLLDYGRYLPPEVRLATLTPKRPTRDMLDLLSQHHIGAIWRGRAGFVSEGLKEL